MDFARVSGSFDSATFVNAPGDFHFSSNYQEARERFLSGCAAAAAQVHSMQHPELGPDGRALYTDVALLGTQQAGLTLVLQSGTHGAEGFAGSAIQTALLSDPSLEATLSGVRLILIHAINPWGFAHLRRTNEDNVDLNRNFIDRSQPYPANPPYQRLAAVLAPSRMSFLTKGKTLLRLFTYGICHGSAALRTAVTGGQYSHPEGLFFGGHAAVWSNNVFRQTVQSHVVGAKRAVFLDLHTGLGPCGHGELIMADPKGSPAHRRGVSWWGGRVKTTKAGESVSTDLVGTLRNAVTQILVDSEVTAGSLEFGTLPARVVLWSLVVENWLHHHVDPTDSRYQPIKAEFRRTFCIDTAEWRAAVLRQGRLVIAQALSGLADPDG